MCAGALGLLRFAQVRHPATLLHLSSLQLLFMLKS